MVRFLPSTTSTSSASTSTYSASTSTSSDTPTPIYRYYEDAVEHSGMREALENFQVVTAALELEPNNPADPNAIQVVVVRSSDGRRFHVGYLPRETAAALTPAIAPAAPPPGAADYPAGARAAWTAPEATVLLLTAPPRPEDGQIDPEVWRKCVVFCPPIR